MAGERRLELERRLAEAGWDMPVVEEPPCDGSGCLNGGEGPCPAQARERRFHIYYLGCSCCYSEAKTYGELDLIICGPICKTAFEGRLDMMNCGGHYQAMWCFDSDEALATIVNDDIPRADEPIDRDD